MSSSCFRLRVRVDISHHRDFLDSNFDVVYIRFKPEHFVITIAGGYEVTHREDDDLVLDALTESRDYSFASKEAGLEGNKITWTIEPPTKINPPEYYIWRIPAYTFLAGRILTFMIEVKRTKFPQYIYTSAASQTVFFSSSRSIKMKCLKNCLDSISDDVTVFMVVCEGACGDEKYRWYSKPNILSEGNFEFGDGTNKLLLKPKAGKEGMGYLFGARLGRTRASYVVYFVNMIRMGECFVEPESGFAGITPFKVSCESFLSLYGDLTYFIYQGDAERDEKAVMLIYGTLAEFSDIFLAEGENNISVAVRNTRYSTHYLHLDSIDLKPLEDGLKDRSVEDWLKYCVLGDGPNSLRRLLLQEDYGALVSQASLLATKLNSTRIGTDVKRDYMKRIVYALSKVKIEHVMNAELLLSVMWKLTDVKDEMNTWVTAEQGKIMAKIAEVLYNCVTDPREEFVTVPYVTNLCQKLLNIFSKLLSRNEELLSKLDELTPEHDYYSYDDMRSDKIIVRLDFNIFMTSMLSAMEFISLSVMKKLITGQKPIEFMTPAVNLSVRKVEPSSLDRYLPSYGENDTRVVLSENLINSLSKYPEVGYQFAIFSKNPFWWHIDRASLNTEFVVFDLIYNNSWIRQLSDDVEIRLKVNELGKESNISGRLEGEKFVVYKITVPSQATLRIEILPDGLKLLLQNCSPTKHEMHSAGVSGKELLHQQGNQEEDLFLGILNPGTQAVDFNGTIFSFICMRWDNKEKKFVRDGFKPSSLQGSKLRCLATHLSVFGGMVGVAPNRVEIPMDIDITLFIQTNLVMLIVLGAVFLLWILLMTWAYIRDRNMKKRNMVFVLKDNVPGDEFGYLVVIVTGKHFDAGTTARVGIQLVGVESKSRPHLIECDQYEPLQRGYEDWFVIYTPVQLGELVELKLWHDCSGRKPHWYCSRVMVQEIWSGKQYCFIVEQWFSLIWGDSEVSREVPLADEKDMKKLGVVYPVTVDLSFRNGHLWLSIFASDPQHNFTTKERVTVSICLLVLSMLVSAMFYGIPKGDESDAIFSRGSYYITMTELLIMLESAAVSIPATIILILLFKKSGPPPRYLKDSEKKEE